MCFKAVGIFEEGQNTVWGKGITPSSSSSKLSILWMSKSTSERLTGECLQGMESLHSDQGGGGTFQRESLEHRGFVHGSL